MNVAQMTLPKAEARRRLRATREQLHRRADSEYQQLESAYKAMANGKPLISLSEVLTDCPRDEKGRPKLAIARADRVQVRFRAALDRSLFRSIGRGPGQSWWGGAAERNPNLNITTQTVGMRAHNYDFEKKVSSGVAEGFALVPIVPPHVRGNNALDTSFILWEVEAWADRVISARPDRDPYLLKRIGGDLFAVVAEWDLTPIEQAIMAGRARN
jgi:hypothetical protein